MIRPFVCFAAALALAPTAGLAQAPMQQRAAEAFMTAIQTQDHKTALLMLDAKVLIQFPQAPGATAQGQGQGQPFVIGYLDGLFGADHELRVDSDVARGDIIRFLAHDLRSKDPYVIDVVVRGSQVVLVNITQPPSPSGGSQAAAAKTGADGG